MFINNQHCYECNKVTQHCNNKCSVCDKKEKRKIEAAWKSLSTDQKIEALRKRIEALEYDGICN